MTTGRRIFSFTTIALIVLLCAALPLVAFAQAETPAATEEPASAASAVPAAVITVTGTVSHGTPGAAMPAQLPDPRHALNAEMGERT